MRNYFPTKFIRTNVGRATPPPGCATHTYKQPYTGSGGTPAWSGVGGPAGPEGLLAFQLPALTLRRLPRPPELTGERAARWGTVRKGGREWPGGRSEACRPAPLYTPL